MDEATEWHWRELSEEVISGMKEWRDQHPKATLREIEEALDERLGKMRARRLCCKNTKGNTKDRVSPFCYCV